MTVRFNLPQGQVFDSNGNPGVGWKLYFYDPGTTTPKDVYSDSELETPLSQPLLSDSAGRFASAFMDPSLYRVILKDSSDVTKIDADDYDPGLAAGFGVSSLVGVAQGGTGAGNPAAARSNLGAASSAALTTAQNDITDLQTAVATGVNGDGEFGDLASKDAVERTDLATSYGTVIVQTVYATPYTTYSDLTDSIPNDDTTPGSTEGTQILTANITPADSSNIVRITFAGFGQPVGTSSTATVALFRDSTCVYALNAGANTSVANLSFSYDDSPSTTSQVTYSIRVGPGNVSHLYINGNAGGRLYNGKAACTMRLEEIEEH